MQKQGDNTEAETKGKALDTDRRNRYYNINRQPVGLCSVNIYKRQ